MPAIHARPRFVLFPPALGRGSPGAARHCMGSDDPAPACFRPFLFREPSTNFLTFPRECDTLNSVYNVDQTEAYEVKTLDKAEYQSKLEQLTSLANKEDYKGALEIVESVDWRRDTNPVDGGGCL